MKIEYSKQAETATFILVDGNILIFHIETGFIKKIICNVINSVLKTTNERKKIKIVVTHFRFTPMQYLFQSYFIEHFKAFWVGDVWKWICIWRSLPLSLLFWSLLK